MRLVKKLAARWANPKLFKEAGELRFRLVNANAAIERLTQERDRAQADLVTWETAHAELKLRRDEAVKQAADLAAENVLQVDRARLAEAAFTDVREEVRRLRRQAELDRKTIDELGNELAEAIVTAEGLGFAMRDMEQAAVERKDFLDDDRRHVRLMDGTEDHL